MKKLIIIGVIAIGLFTPLTIYAQGTIYVSNLGQTADGEHAVGSDSWLAEGFVTGNNADGYLLDSVQLGMADALGNPSGFTAMIYSVVWTSGPFPGTNLSTLTGSTDPLTSNIYTYTAASSLILSPNTSYYLVLTAGTTVANGMYEWDAMNAASYDTSDGWNVLSPTFSSNNGSSWGYPATYPQLLFSQYGITATAIPEPSSAFLLLLGCGVLMCVRRFFHADEHAGSGG